MAGQWRSPHYEVDNGNVPAGLNGGDEDNAVLPPPRDQGSQWRSIVVVVVVVVLGILSQCLPDGWIDDNDGDDNDGDDGNDTGAAAGQSRPRDESTSLRGVDPAKNGGGEIGWGLPPQLVGVIGEGGEGRVTRLSATR